MSRSKVKCPHCSKEVEVEGSGKFKCPHCDGIFKLNDQSNNKKSIDKNIKTLLIIGGVIALVIIFPTIACFSMDTNDTQEETADVKSVTKYVEEIEQKIIENNFDQALEIAKDASNHSDNEEIDDILSALREFQQNEFVKNELLKLSDEEVEQLENDSLEKVYTKNEILNDAILNELKYSLLDLPAYKVQARNELISKQFSAWNGSQKKLVRLVKDNMHDPKSFEHVDTSYEDKGDYLLVMMKYRGNNMFGAKVLNTIVVKTDIDTGEILEIVEE